MFSLQVLSSESEWKWINDKVKNVLDCLLDIFKDLLSRILCYNCIVVSCVDQQFKLN